MAERHYNSYWEKWFKYGGEWFISFIFNLFFQGFFIEWYTLMRVQLSH